ncbi:MAG: EamA family transporter RarD, partial [Verrucomicrobia bacterium]|nr:EamA family transporter RarD [Verrucomicrobiota bacterium]
MAQPVGDARPASPARTLASKVATATFAGVAGTAMSVREAKELRKTRAGLGYGLTAYTMWGVFPIYFRALTHVSPWVILGHRILWSAVFLSVIVSLRREWPLLLPVVRERRNLLLLAAGGVLIAVNWLVFIHAVVTGQLLESSLGYFINPLFSVALGMVFLHERLRRWQWVAVAIAGLAVANLTFRGERIPWIALSLAGSFGLYGLVRKKVDINTLHGLLVETTVLLPVAFVGLMSLPTSQPSPGTLGLLSFLGVITAIPLLLFGAALRRLPLSTVGFLQYVGPTLQFLVAIVLFREPLDHAKLVSFGLCWAAIAVYVVDSVRTHTAQPVADRPE